MAHFHGPAMPGQNGGVQIGIDAASNPSSGSAILTLDQVDDLLAGLWYVNIHSEMFPAGEIRGQVLAVQPIPLPAETPCRKYGQRDGSTQSQWMPRGLERMAANQSARPRDPASKVCLDAAHTARCQS